MTIFAIMLLALAVVIMIFIMILTQVTLANIYERFFM